MNSYTLNRTYIHTFYVDAVIISIAMLISVFSHLIFPIYQINPILFLLMLSIPYNSKQWNAHILATLIPMFTYMITGMPTLTKVMCMAIEYNIVLSVYFLLQDKIATQNIVAMFGIMLFAILIGKCAYYTSKTILLGAIFIDTPFITQLTSCVVISLGSSVFIKFKTK